jgi:hypothetical protein
MKSHANSRRPRQTLAPFTLSARQHQARTDYQRQAPANTKLERRPISRRSIKIHQFLIDNAAIRNRCK